MDNIKINGMFRTPDDMGEIQDWIERHNSDDKAHLYTAAMMTFNLFANAIAKEPDNVVYNAMIQAVIDRSDPDRGKASAKITAMDYLEEMQYGEIKNWAILITEKSMIVVFDPSDYSFHLETIEEDAEI